MIVFDSNCVNPYGPELAQQLGDSGRPVRLAGAVDTWFPLAPAFGLRPTRRGASTREVLRDVLATLQVAVALTRGEDVVVVWARYYQKALLVLGSLGRGRLLVLGHNLGSGRDLRGWRGRVDHVLHRRSTVLLHGHPQGVEAARRQGLRHAVVQHPLFTHYWRHASADLPAAERRGILLLGALRPDKLTAGDLRDLVARLRVLTDEPVTVAVHPRVELDGVRNLSQDTPLTDAAVAEALATSRVLLAPYRNPTDSSTIHLALAAGLRVVAYRGGALGQYDDLVLVEPGDLDALCALALEDGRPTAAAGDRMAGWLAVL